MTISVLIVDDHQIVRNGLRMLVEGQPDMTVVGEAESGEGSIDLYGQLRPHVVLMDISMPGLDGVAATRGILSADPTALIVMLTSYSEESRIRSALEAGARGYVLKDASPDQILAAIRTASSGGTWLDDRVASSLLSAGNPAAVQELTPRELQVLRLVGAGLLNKQIGARLGISEKTVKAHLGRIFTRLGVSDRTQAALWAERNGLLPESERDDGPTTIV